MNLLSILQALIAVCLAAYAVNAVLLLILYGMVDERSSRCCEAQAVDRERLPSVTVQVPLYNERHVVERVIDALAALDYPRDKLEIQVLDDSDDETSLLAASRVAHHQARGVAIDLFRRRERVGYKAGALAWGLARAHGEYIAIFDADFCPHSDFLLRTVPLFTDDPRLGFVQARWSYLNAEYSLVTRIQALALDGHFAVEQVARSRSGLFINFNGTGGVWRKVCIEQSGGWQSDTLCEDLDISFRAQLSGWRGIYLSDVAVPAELTPQLAAFKQQQGRWSRGSAQTLRKLFGPLLRGAKTSGLQKALGLLHLGGYLAQVLAVAFLLVTLLLWLIPGARQVPLGGLGLLAIGPPLLYAVAQQRLYRDWPRRLWAVPFLLLVGVGLSWGNTVAFIQGLTRWGGSFVRTPKFQLHGKAGRWLDSSYRASISRSLVGEAFLAGYAVLATVVAWRTGRYSAIPAMAYYALGFTTVAVIELVQITSARLARGRFRSSAPVDASSSDS